MIAFSPFQLIGFSEMHNEGLIQAYARGQLVRRNPGMGAELTGPAQGAVFLASLVGVVADTTWQGRAVA
ncbi:MAG: hypothetical protein ACYDC5_11395 [Candidatus Dormibacteria bacterium]